MSTYVSIFLFFPVKSSAPRCHMKFDDTFDDISAVFFEKSFGLLCCIYAVLCNFMYPFSFAISLAFRSSATHT